MYLYPAQDKEYLITKSVSALFFISCSLCYIASSVCDWRTGVTLFTCVRECILSHTSTITYSPPRLKGLGRGWILSTAGQGSCRLANTPTERCWLIGCYGEVRQTILSALVKALMARHAETHTKKLTHTAWRQFHSVILDFHGEIIDSETGRERQKAWEEEGEEIWPRGEEQQVRKY